MHMYSTYIVSAGVAHVAMYMHMYVCLRDSNCTHINTQ